MFEFTPDQIQEIMNIIRQNNLVYAIGSIGLEALPKDDIEYLKNRGINIDKLIVEMTPYEQAFYFGRLTTILGDERAKTLSYNDFITKVKKGELNPLSTTEEKMLNLAKNRTYNHITWLTINEQQDVNNIINEETRQMLEKQKIIKDEIALGVEQRKAYRRMSNDISKKLGDWQKNIDRIVETEYNNIFQEGRAAEMESEQLVYKEVYDQACRHCISAYLTSGIGSKPKIFTLAQMTANGMNNIGRKVADWKPVLGSMHPFCRCLLKKVPDYSVWDEEKKDWVLKEAKKPEERKWKGNIKIVNQ